MRNRIEVPTRFRHLNTYQEIKELARNELKAFVQNKANPLEERWALFKAHGQELGFYENYIQHFSSLNSTLKDNLLENYDRYRTITTPSLVGRLTTLLGKEYEDGEITQELINNFQEEILEKFLWSFEFDW